MLTLSQLPAFGLMSQIFQWYAVARLRCESPGRVIPNPRPGASSCCRSVRSGAAGCCPRDRFGPRCASAGGGPERDGRKTEVPSAAVTREAWGSSKYRPEFADFGHDAPAAATVAGIVMLGRDRHVDEMPAGAAGNVAAVFVGPGRGVRQRFAGFEQVANDAPWLVARVATRQVSPRHDGREAPRRGRVE